MEKQATKPDETNQRQILPKNVNLYRQIALKASTASGVKLGAGYILSLFREMLEPQDIVPAWDALHHRYIAWPALRGLESIYTEQDSDCPKKLTCGSLNFLSDETQPCLHRQVIKDIDLRRSPATITHRETRSLRWFEVSLFTVATAGLGGYKKQGKLPGDGRPRESLRRSHLPEWRRIG